MTGELEQLLAILKISELPLAFTAIFGEVLGRLVLASGIRIEQSLTDAVAEKASDVVEVGMRCRSRDLARLFVVGEPRGVLATVVDVDRLDDVGAVTSEIGLESLEDWPHVFGRRIGERAEVVAPDRFKGRSPGGGPF